MRKNENIILMINNFTMCTCICIQQQQNQEEKELSETEIICRL